MAQLDWSATINSIRESLPPVQFTNWIQPLEFLRSDERSIVLGVPSRFHEQWLKENFTQHLTRAIQKHGGPNLQLEFEVLVRNENVEAASSAVEITPPVQRPTLRVVEETSEEGEESAPVQPHVRPNYPKQQNAYRAYAFNKTAFQAAELFCDTSTNPLSALFIIADVGMGKTHLLSEIGEMLHLQDRRHRIRYTNAEAFTAEMYQSFKANSNDAFRQKYREETDCLLFDDIQGLSGRNTSQETLLHIFNDIQAAGGRIAFASPVPPKALQKFTGPLLSRLMSMVSVEIATPSFEDRVEILAGVCEENKMNVSGDVLRTLADKGQKDVRELIGTIVRVHLQAKLQNRPLDNTYLSEEGWMRETPKASITMEEIVSLVELNFSISRTELVSKCRKNPTVWPRQVAMYLARRFTLMPLGAIGAIFGRDHATVIHAYDKVVAAMKEQPTRQYEIEYLAQKLESRKPRKDDGKLL